MVSICDVSGHHGSFSELGKHEHAHITPSEAGSSVNLVESPLLYNGARSYKEQVIKHFPGICYVVLYIVLLIGFEVMVFVCYDVLHLKILGGVEEPFALLTVMHVFLWLLTFVYDRYLHFHHHGLRRCGYLNIFMRTKELRRIPLMIFSLGNASLLLLVAFMENRDNEGVSLIRMFHLVASIEVAICLIATIIYLSFMISFNRQKNMPDVFNNVLINGSDGEQSSIPEVGFRDNDGLDDVLEKQSEMIQYLQQHNTNLSKRIVHLTQLLPKDEQQVVLNSSNINPHLYT